MPSLRISLAYTYFCIILFLTTGILADSTENAEVKEELSDVTSNYVDTGCEFYLAPSLVPGSGRGIISGKHFSKGDIIDVASSLTVKHSAIRNWPLNNYVYSSEDESYSMILFGLAMIFNHRKEKDVEHKWMDWPVVEVSLQKNEAHTIYTEVSHETTREVFAGEELFTSYGDDDWFTSRNIILNKTIPHIVKYDINELKSIGHCLSDVSVKDSTLPLAGKGLYAKKDFKKDEIISISPVLVLPKHEVERMNDVSVLYNYVITSEGSDVAIFPIGLAAMANHGGVESNMVMSWYVWSNEDDTFANNLKKTGDDLLASPFAQLDLAYRATRDISAGEELLLFYGEDWENKWVSHLDKLLEWLPESEEEDKNKPQFRHSIEAPSGLFPKWWKSPCIGENCVMIRRQAEIDADPKQKKRQEEAMIKAKEALERARNLARKNYVKPGAGEGSCSSNKKGVAETPVTGLWDRIGQLWNQ